MKQEKEPLLEKLFILLGTLDAITLTIIFFFIIGILTICVFLASIMQTGEGIILFYKSIEAIVKNNNAFLSVGFTGMSLLYLIVIILLWSLFIRLIKCYPSAIQKLKAYLLIEKIKEPKPKKKRTKLFVFLIIILILAISMIITSSIGNEFNNVISFIRRYFDFEYIGKVFLRWFK